MANANAHTQLEIYEAIDRKFLLSYGYGSSIYLLLKWPGNPRWLFKTELLEAEEAWHAAVDA